MCPRSSNVGQQRQIQGGCNLLKLENGVPSHDTFSRLFRILDPDQFRASFQRFMEKFSAHWRLDVVMNEDQGRTRLGNGPHNLAVLRHMALNAMQKEGSKGSLRGKFERAGRHDDYLKSFLTMF
jgi:hypothetical protein